VKNLGTVIANEVKQSYAQKKELPMPESGFVVRFEDKEEIRCASIDLDYDSWAGDGKI
jgi:hypothetical protein